jgi:AcrR family transcriptional regulator
VTDSGRRTEESATSSATVGVPQGLVTAPRWGVRSPHPVRKEQILIAAADLVADHGYHRVSMSDIGAAAGVTGPAIYRHFDGKPSVLVALFDRVIDKLLSQAQAIVIQCADIPTALQELVAAQVDFVVADRHLAQVYYHEIHNLPEADSRRLRRKQRLYLEEWVHLLGELDPRRNDGEVHTLVHAAIGTIQSSLFHANGLPEDRLRELLTESACLLLGIEPPVMPKP